MASKGVENLNPQRFLKKTKREITSEDEDESIQDPIDDREVFGKMEQKFGIRESNHQLFKYNYSNI